MATAGGASGGNCATGSFSNASTPAIINMMARTQAKIGLSMKKRAMRLPRKLEWTSACGERRLHALGVGLVHRDLRAHRDLYAGLDALQTAHDQTVARTQTFRDHPLITERAVELDGAPFDRIARSHHERGSGAIRRMRDALLGGENGTVAYAFLDRRA